MVMPLCICCHRESRRPVTQQPTGTCLDKRLQVFLQVSPETISPHFVQWNMVMGMTCNFMSAVFYLLNQTGILQGNLSYDEKGGLAVMPVEKLEILQRHCRDGFPVVLTVRHHQPYIFQVDTEQQGSPLLPAIIVTCVGKIWQKNNSLYKVPVDIAVQDIARSLSAFHIWL